MNFQESTTILNAHTKKVWKVEWKVGVETWKSGKVWKLGVEVGVVSDFTYSYEVHTISVHLVTISEIRNHSNTHTHTHTTYQISKEKEG